MAKVIKRVVISCLVCVLLELAIVALYSYLYRLSGKAPLTFSVSRVIAMLAVFWGTSGLMRLQKGPDYGISNDTGK